MTHPQLPRALELARISLLFGQVRRVTQHVDGEYESDTTHTVMLALLAIELAPQFDCDPGLAAMFAVVHDLPETYALDTNTARQLSPEQAAAKAQREADAVARLGVELDGSHVLELLRRYEAQDEREARMVRYLDKILPKLTHYLNGGSALRALGLTVADMRESHRVQGAKLEREYPEFGAVADLFRAACDLVDEGVSAGRVVLAEGPAA